MVTEGPFSTVSHRLGGFAAFFLLFSFYIVFDKYQHIYIYFQKSIQVCVCFWYSFISFPFFFFFCLAWLTQSLSPYQALQPRFPQNTPLGLPFMSPHSYDLTQKRGSENAFTEIVSHCWFYPNGMASCMLVFILFFSFNSTP